MRASLVLIRGGFVESSCFSSIFYGNNKSHRHHATGHATHTTRPGGRRARHAAIDRGGRKVTLISASVALPLFLSWMVKKNKGVAPSLRTVVPSAVAADAAEPSGGELELPHSLTPSLPHSLTPSLPHSLSFCCCFPTVNWSCC